MRNQDRAEFVRVIVGLSAIKPGQKLTEEGVDLFWRAMREWDIGEFRAAAEQLARSVEFMPNPFHFEQLRKAAKPTAAECWAKALAHAADLPVSGGYLQERPSGDARLDAIVRTVGGYKAIANASERDLQFMASRFAENFESVSDAVDTREALPWLDKLLLEKAYNDPKALT